jgi:hypothetical protein
MAWRWVLMTNRIVIDNCGWHACSGGIRVLNYMAALIHSIGHPVAITSVCYYNPALPGVGGQCDPDDIVVYPEIVPGNPLQGQRVVRWQLYYPPYRSAKGDCVISFHPEYMAKCREMSDDPVPDDYILRLPGIDHGEWLYPEPKIIENCLFIGKRNCQEAPDIPGIVDIAGSHDLWFNRMRTIAVLRRSKNFYTMDHFTVMEDEAALCGCKVFRVFGAHEFREQFIDDASTRIMRPVRDQLYAHRFLNLIARFFKL